MTVWSTVRADHHQFSVGARDADTLDVGERGSLLEVGPGFATLKTGVGYGPVRVGVDVLSSPPSDDIPLDWEVIEECDLEVTTEFTVMTLEGERAEGFDSVTDIPHSRYRIRAYARGRDVNWDLDVREPSEDYWLRLWPASAPGEFQQLRKHDAAWKTPNDELDLDEKLTARRPNLHPGRVTVYDDAGSLKYVPLFSEEGKAARMSFTSWGGRDPAPELADNFLAKQVAALDRGLLDKIADADPETQRAVGLWAARRAYERAEFTGSEWADSLLAAAEGGEPFPEEVSTLSQALNAMLDDRRLRLTVARGTPGAGDFWVQERAVIAPFSACHEDPFTAALEAVRTAGETFGSDYLEFVAQIKAEFMF